MQEVRIGGKYRHFKNKEYRLMAIAEHTETGEKLVVYQALYGEQAVWARPFEMFFSPVDRVKSPDACQQDRFELIEE